MYEDLLNKIANLESRIKQLEKRVYAKDNISSFICPQCNSDSVRLKNNTLTKRNEAGEFIEVRLWKCGQMFCDFFRSN